MLRNGTPWAKGAFMLEGNHGSRPDGRPDVESQRIDVDAEGRFTFLGRPGRYSVIRSRDGVRVSADATVDLVRGTVVRQTFTFAIGTLVVRVTDPSGVPAQYVNVHVEPGAGAVSTKLAGEASIEVMAETPVALRVLPKRLDSTEARQQLMRDAAAAGGGDPFGAHWLVIGTTTVKAGETTTLEVRLPPEWAK